MQLKDKDVREIVIRDLQNRVSELTASRLLLEDEVAQLKAELEQKVPVRISDERVLSAEARSLSVKPGVWRGWPRICSMYRASPLVSSP